MLNLLDTTDVPLNIRNIIVLFIWRIPDHIQIISIYLPLAMPQVLHFFSQSGYLVLSYIETILKFLSFFNEFHNVTC